MKHSNKTKDLMVDSGAVTHVCPPWFSPQTTLHKLQQGAGPDLRTATDDILESMATNGPTRSTTKIKQWSFRFALAKIPKLPTGCDPVVASGNQTYQSASSKVSKQNANQASYPFHVNMPSQAKWKQKSLMNVILDIQVISKNMYAIRKHADPKRNKF